MESGEGPWQQRHRAEAPGSEGATKSGARFHNICSHPGFVESWASKNIEGHTIIISLPPQLDSPSTALKI